MNISDNWHKYSKTIALNNLIIPMSKFFLIAGLLALFNLTVFAQGKSSLDIKIGDVDSLIIEIDNRYYPDSSIFMGNSTLLGSYRGVFYKQIEAHKIVKVLLYHGFLKNKIAIYIHNDSICCIAKDNNIFYKIQGILYSSKKEIELSESLSKEMLEYEAIINNLKRILN